MGVFLLACCLPAVETILRQTDEAVPGLEEAIPWMGRYADRIPHSLIGRVLARQHQIVAVRRALSEVSIPTKTPPSLDSCRRSDADNGLYDYLELLLLLRSGEGGDPALRAQLRRVTTASPARLYVFRQRQVVDEALRQQKISPRRAAVAAWESCTWVQEPFGRVFRELARLLAAKGSDWREAGRPADALLAHATIVRLATDLAKESPAPTVVLLASELTASGCREMARDWVAAPAGSQPAGASSVSGSSGPRPAGSLAFEAEAVRAAALGDTWHRTVDATGVGVLPWMGRAIHVLLARAEHQRLMAALVGSLLGLECCLMLLVLLVPLGIAAALTRMPPGAGSGWRGGRWAPWMAALLPVVPVAAGWLFLRLASVDFTWLLSAPSLAGVALIPASTVILTGLAVHGAAVVIEKDRWYGWSLKGVYAGVAVLLLTVVLVVFASVGQAPWRPPPAVRGFRIAGFLMTVDCFVLLVLFVASNLSRRIQGRFSLAILSRVFLPVISAAFLYAGVLTFTLLRINEAGNAAHQRAFSCVAADPVAEQLGPGWYRDHLAGARALIETFGAR